MATNEEVAETRRRLEEEDAWHSAPQLEDPNGEAKFIRMMEDIHKLAVSPHGDALRISTFSGVVPPPKNEATFSQ